MFCVIKILDFKKLKFLKFTPELIFFETFGILEFNQ